MNALGKFAREVCIERIYTIRKLRRKDKYIYAYLRISMCTYEWSHEGKMCVYVYVYVCVYTYIYFPSFTVA